MEAPLFDITGPVWEMPYDLAELDDEAPTRFVSRALIGHPLVIGQPAKDTKRAYDEAIERHQKGYFSAVEIAFMLAEQQQSQPHYFAEKIMDAYKGNMLQFYDPKVGKYPGHIKGKTDPLCRELNNCIYTTYDAINRWLRESEEPYGLEQHKPATHGKKQAQQRDLILETIRELGYDPGALPPQKPGRAGIRAAVWEVLKANQLFGDTRNPFDTAWKELRRYKLIRHGE